MRAALAPAAAAAAAVAACGGDPAPYCGDGIVQPQLGEQCDDGNDDQTDFCRDCLAYLPPRTIVKWAFNVTDTFPGDSCTDLGVTRVRVRVSGPREETLEDGCSVRQVVFQDLPAGAYTASVLPLDSGGTALVTAAVEAPVTASAADAEVTVVVPHDRWTTAYTGTFLFTVRWGGLDCAPAAVAQQQISMWVDGALVMRSTTGSPPLPLDGSARGPCVPAGNPSPQSALLVPFGPASVTIVGFDGAGDEAFRGSYDTFVGAGVSNPTIEFDVPTIFDAMPAEIDADVDAM